MKFWDSEIKGVFEFDKSRSELISNLEMLSNMSVQEQTLYKKWEELNSNLYQSMLHLPTYQSYIDVVWKPTDIFDFNLTIKEINSLQPYVHIIENYEVKKWTDIRRMISSMEYTKNPGRNIKAFVKDRTTGKILGVISLSSDVVSVKVRDQYIGWNKKNKFEDGKLNSIAMGTAIISSQPFGYNFLGGKLMAALTTSPTFRSEWKEKYGDEMIAVHTTSLYGNGSMYNSIPHFKPLGETTGMISIKPDDKVYLPWLQWIKENYPDFYQYSVEATGPKQVMLNRIFKEIGVKKSQYNHGFHRGVYFAQMYENGNQYLCGQISQQELQIKDKFKRGDDYTIDWWKKKAVNRYTNLFNDNKIKPETLFYSDIIGMSWQECKDKYLSEVGR